MSSQSAGASLTLRFARFSSGVLAERIVDEGGGGEGMEARIRSTAARFVVVRCD